MIEHGHIDRLDPVLTDAVERALAPLRGKALDAVLLGCTHYGIIGRAITEFLGPETALVSASVCGAAQVAQYLIVNGLTGGCGEERFFASGDPADFTRAASTFLGRPMARGAEQAPLMEF
jgi:glutamate racemase